MRILIIFNVGSNFLLSNEPKRMKCAEGGECMREYLNSHTFKVLVVNSQEKRLRGRTNLRWKDNIKMDLRATNCDGWEWILPNEDRASGWHSRETFHFHYRLCCIHLIMEPWVCYYSELNYAYGWFYSVIHFKTSHPKGQNLQTSEHFCEEKWSF